MVVVDEKAMLPPPPAYSSSASSNGSPVPQSLHPPPFLAAFRKLATLSDLPAHLLLHIVHRTFPQAPDKDYNKIERQRKTLRWLTMSLRLVNRTFYIGMSEAACSILSNPPSRHVAVLPLLLYSHLSLSQSLKLKH
jgi:hypothetical protein